MSQAGWQACRQRIVAGLRHALEGQAAMTKRLEDEERIRNLRLPRPDAGSRASLDECRLVAGQAMVRLGTWVSREKGGSLPQRFREAGRIRSAVSAEARPRSGHQGFRPVRRVAARIEDLQSHGRGRRRGRGIRPGSRQRPGDFIDEAYSRRLLIGRRMQSLARAVTRGLPPA